MVLTEWLNACCELLVIMVKALIKTLLKWNYKIIYVALVIEVKILF